MFDHNVSMQGRLQQFDIKHGSDCVRIEGWYVYSDGAMREVNPYGALHEPPGNAFECWKIKVQYREEQLQQAVDEFHEARNSYLEIARARLRNGDPCESKEGAVARLTKLQTTVKECQRQLRIARVKLDAATPASHKARIRGVAESKQNNEQLIDAVSRIKI